MSREIKFRAWALAGVMHPVWKKFDDEDGKYILMQYTGLKDKNGVEIYEGDIISCMGGYEEGESELPGDVQFLDGSWYVISGSDSILLYEYDINSVIGNIYDDPELFKEVV